MLERQIIGAITGECGCGSLGGSAGNRNCLLTCWCGRREGGLTGEGGTGISGSCYGIGIVWRYLPCADCVVPTTVELMSIDIETDGEHLTDLNVKVGYAVSAEDFEATLFGVLLHCFQDVGSYLPFTAGALRNTSALREDHDNFTR